MKRSEIRKDFIVDKYVIISPKRGTRPNELKKDPLTPINVPQKDCAFCPEMVDKVPALLTIGPKRKTWHVKVIKNIFPAVSLDNPRAYGTQEVIIETPHHSKQLDELPVSHIVKVLDVYAARTRAVTKLRNIEYILIFKNSGGNAGASIQHSHSQLFATKLIPPQLLRRSASAEEYRNRTAHCAYCAMMKFEEGSKRLIEKNRYVSVFAPYASQNNYEAWILPQRHLDNITQLRLNERRAIATSLKKILQKISALGLSYNYYFHQVVNDNHQHLYLKIRPRGSVWAGVEIGSGVIINPVPPEDAATFYRS